jgi:hypothetical protein
MNISDKADYVRAEAKRNETFNHHCHWPGCTKRVPPALWGCKQHWFMLPASLRARIWRTYRPGQEATKDPSADYLAVAREVQNWIAERAAK